MTALRRVLPAALALGLAALSAAPGASAAGRAQDTTWHGTQIKMYAAQSAGRSGSGVVVGVLDGWVDRSHPDFEGRVRQGADCTSGTCVAGQTKDGCTHGTHVAGTVASSSFGVAPKATVLPVRVLQDDGEGGCTGDPANVAAGIRWAVAHGAKVLNLSLGPDVPGLGSSSQIPTAVREAADAGVVVVFSAGNADLPVAQAYDDNALVVAATGPNGRLASYSQHGTGVSVAAPGGQPDSSDTCTQTSCVTSLYPGGKYAVAAGTSMAAPHVAGIAALLLGQTPSRSRQQVVDRITGTAHALAEAGAGLVDARAALGASGAAPAPSAAPKPVPVVQQPSRTTTTRTPATTAPKPATTAPKPVAPKPAPKPVATKAAPVVTAPPAEPAPLAPTAEPVLVLRSTATEVPVPVAIVAMALVALSGVSVVGLSLRSRS